MKPFIKEFCKRGLLVCAGGPVVLAIIYGLSDGAITLQASKVCIEILTITLMSFIAAGITAVYQIERLPLLWAILLHGSVLYVDYLGIYMLNGWLQASNVIIFTAIFVAGYALIWLIIYLATRRNAKQLNQKIGK